VVAAHRLGGRISRQHGLAAALAAAFWPEFALFAGQALTDAIAVPVVLMATAALQERRRWWVAVAGGLLALAVAIRFPDGPAIGVLAAMSLRRDWRGWGWLALGALVGLVLAAVPDMALGHAPYGWVAENWRQNMVAGHAQGYGTGGPFFYLIQLLAIWAFWLFPALWLARAGGRHYPALMAMAVANVLVHTVIAHKEFRFILLSEMTMVILAALGSVDVLRRWSDRRSRYLLIGGWVLAAATMLMMPGEMEDWDESVPANRAAVALRHDGATCGVALWRVWWASSGGYTYLHRPVPIYLPDRQPDPRGALVAHQATFNTILASSRLTAPLPDAYRPVQCFGPQGLYGDDGVCIWRRVGGCDRGAAEGMLIDRVVGTPEQPGDYNRWAARGG